MSNWDDFVAGIKAYVEANGLIDELYIFDHGNTYVDQNGQQTGNHAQQFGEAAVTAEMFAQLAPYLSGDAVVILGGCSVGKDAAYVDGLAGAAGATVIASDANVAYGPENWGDPDFYSEGEWKVFDGTGSSSGSSVSPNDYDLYSIPAENASKGDGSGSGSSSGSGSV